MRRGVIPVQHDKRGVSPVFAELLMVAIMVVMGATVYLMFNPPYDQARKEPTVLIFRDEGQLHADAPGYCCLNDTILDVVAVTGEPRGWVSGLEYQVLDAAGTRVLVGGEMSAAPSDPGLTYSGVYHGSPSEPSIINVWYVDLDHDGFVSAPDHIEIRGMSGDYHEGKFKILTETRVLATQVLP